MRFTVPFLLAIAVFTGTVLGANQTSFNPNEDLLFDIVSAADALSFRLERAFGLTNNVGLAIGGFLLAVPALLTFHVFRVGFGGGVHAIVQDREAALKRAEEYRKLPNSVVRYRQAEAKSRARTRARAQSAEAKQKPDRPKSGEVLSGDIRAGEKARDVGEDTQKSGGLGANLTAAFAGRGSASTSSGMTSLSSGGNSESETAGNSLRGSWDTLLEKRPNFSALKSSAADGIRKGLERTGKVASGVTGFGKDRSRDA